MRRCSHIDSFVKLEAYPEYKEARWINSRHDYFKSYSGRFFKSIEDVVYKNPWFIKHVPVPDRPALINQLYSAGLYFYENDFKAFESHFTRKIMDTIECTLYRHMLQKYPKDARFICKVLQGHNRLHTRIGVMAECEARRMSGDMCTSLGNGFSNLMLVLYIVAKKNGFVKGFVEGDDGLFASTVRITEEDYKQLGFTVEIHEVPHPKYAHFCGMTVTTAGEVIKNPRVVLSKFGWTHSCIHAGAPVMDQLLKAKSLSLCYELPQAPIVGQLARVSLSLVKQVEPRFEQGEWRLPPLDYTGPTDEFAPSEEARLMVEQIWHVSVGLQLLIEEAIRNLDMERVASLLPSEGDMANYASRYVEVT